MLFVLAIDPSAGAALIGGATGESKENIDSVALRPI
jgi:hypothetical protein